MSSRKLMFGLSACLLLCPAATVAAYGDDDDDDKQPKVRTVRVDCSTGHSINKAFNRHKNADALIIEIDGICDENVLVQRDNVTLSGINPDEYGEPTDGIQAVSTDPDAPPNFGATLLIRDVLNVTVENLKLTGGAVGLRIVDSGSGPLLRIFVKNCSLEENTNRGLTLARTVAQFEHTVIAENSQGAIATNRSNFFCEHCLIEGTLLGTSSYLSLSHSKLERFFLLVNSFLRLENTVQTDNPIPRFSLVNDNSELRIATNSTVLGPTIVNGFSTGILEAGTTHTGNLVCGTGGDVVCPGATINGTSNCLQCLVP